MADFLICLLSCAQDTINNTTCGLFCQVIFEIETSVCKVFDIKRARPCEREAFNPIASEYHASCNPPFYQCMGNYEFYYKIQIFNFFHFMHPFQPKFRSLIIKGVEQRFKFKTLQILSPILENSDGRKRCSTDSQNLIRR